MHSIETSAVGYIYFNFRFQDDKLLLLYGKKSPFVMLNGREYVIKTIIDKVFQNIGI